MKATQTHLPSLMGSLLFLLGAVISLGVAALMVAVTVGSLITDKQIEVSETILLAVLAFEGLVLLGAAIVSVQKILQKPSADADSTYSISAWQVAACLIVAGVAILIGHQIINSEPVNWLLVPILTLPAVILPILLLFGLGTSGISLGPRWRTWNVLGISMTLVPFITFILEALMIVFVFILGIMYILSQPELMAEMERLSQQFYLFQSDPEAILDLVAPLLMRPGILVVALLFFSVLVPMLEELVKPLGVWLFANQIRSPAQGFALGALSGSAYALIETLGVSPQTADWAALLLTRLGTDILHVTTSALMGAGIVYAVRERRYWRLLGIYLMSISMHGLWNGLAILFTFSTAAEQIEQASALQGMATPIAVGMGILAVIFLVILVLANRKMRSTLPIPVADEPAASLENSHGKIPQ